VDEAAQLAAALAESAAMATAASTSLRRHAPSCGGRATR